MEPVGQKPLSIRMQVDTDGKGGTERNKGRGDSKKCIVQEKNLFFNEKAK